MQHEKARTRAEHRLESVQNPCSQSCDKDARAIESDEATRAKFWGKVSTADDGVCWTWNGAVTGNGYGNFRLQSPYRDTIGAHRFSYLICNGPIPSGHVVRHKCDNPRCVNPSHLSTGSKADNARDMVERGRAPIRDQAGEKNGSAKLTWAKVVEIKKLIAEGRNNTVIASEFGVGHATISSIRRGKSWASMT